MQRDENEADETDSSMQEDKDDDDDERPLMLRPYADQAKALYENMQSTSTHGFSSTLFVNFHHLVAYNAELAEAIQSEYYRFEPYLRRAVYSFVRDLYPTMDTSAHFYMAMFHLPTPPKSIRKLKMDLVGSLTSVTATVTRSSEVRPELVEASFRCQKCGLLAEGIVQQFQFTRPTICRNPRCKNMAPLQFRLEVSESEFVDWQKLRVQENASHIPPGSMPRSMDVILRNEMVERAKAGDKCVFTGTLVVLPDGSALARAGEAPVSKRSRPSDAATGGGGGVSGLKALGVRELTYRTCFVATSVLPAESLQHANTNEQVLASTLFAQERTEQDDPTTQQVAMEFSAAQREEIRHMQQSPRLYEQMVDSICPKTFGHREVKKGILLMLLGGIHKTTVQDGIRLRGDINVCVIGDPSTAKSQFLKYVHAFLPNRAVYTSGKASSAAGLTAAVQRDQDTGEYCIEAGALMLADNGICCIVSLEGRWKYDASILVLSPTNTLSCLLSQDEFDKMDPRDQVAIHEAMEQQTITITKAGIQATLNARASILAAANPIYGRYDRTKTLKANVALSAPILSRFDLFFVVLDDCNPDSDRQVANHILQIHRCNEAATAIKPPFTLEQMRRYIRFARTLNPKLTQESQRVLVDCYRKLRQGDTLGRSRSAYRITVRQLESMIRLSEALARLHCSDEIQPSYVREAYRLLKTSIIQVETCDVEMDEDEDEDDENAPAAGGDDDDDAMEDSQEQGVETQPPVVANPGEYAPGTEEEADANPESATDAKPETPQKEPEVQAQKKKKKKKTKISFEEYEAITNAIAGHLRALEGEEGGTNNYLTWDKAMEWYLDQCLEDIRDSQDRLEEMKKKVNLVIRRLIDVDRILVTVGEAPKSKRDQGRTVLAVHPNYEVS